MECFEDVLREKKYQLKKYWFHIKISLHCTWLIARFLPSISPLKFLRVRILFSLKKVDNSFRASSVSYIWLKKNNCVQLGFKTSNSFHRICLLPCHFLTDCPEFLPTFWPTDLLFLRSGPCLRFQFLHASRRTPFDTKALFMQPCAGAIINRKLKMILIRFLNQTKLSTVINKDFYGFLM